MYEHLSEGAVNVLHKSLEERIDFVEGDEWTIMHAYLLKLLRLVDKKIRGPIINRADGFIVHSNAFNGKSRAMKYIRNLHGRTYPDKDSAYPIQRVIYVLANTDMKPIDLRISILSDILSPHLVRTTDAAVKKQLRVVLPAVGARVLIIDELQDIMVGSVDKKETYLQAIKDISNLFNLHILGAGLSNLENLIGNESQLGTRFRADKLPLWHVDGSDKSLNKFKQLVEAIASNMPFPQPSTLTDDDSLNAIAEMNQEGLLGGICRTIVDGAVLALEEDAKVLTVDHVKKAQTRRLGGFFDSEDD